MLSLRVLCIIAFPFSPVLARHSHWLKRGVNATASCQPDVGILGYNASSADSQPYFTFDELYNLQKSFLDAFIYPNNIAVAKSINSSLLAPNVLGRVDLTRTFTGPELNTEYLFGLFTNLALNPSSLSLLGYPTSYHITHFAASQNIVSTSTIITFNFISIGVLVPVEIDTWNMYNSQGQIVQYDATFRWFEYLVDTLIDKAGVMFNTSSIDQTVGILQQGLAQGICTTHQNYCTGGNQQYSSFADCIDFLTKQVRFGKAYELGRDTVLCRMVHENMVPFRPEVHCPHIGMTGGGMCVDDSTYGQKVLEPFFTNGPFVPYGYESTDPKVATM